MLPTVNIFNQYPKTSASRAVYELVIHSDYRHYGDPNLPLVSPRTVWRCLRQPTTCQDEETYILYIYINIYIYDIICVSMINSTTYGNERDLDPFSWGVLFPKKNSLRKRLLYRVRNVRHAEAMSGCSEQNSAETKKSRVANYCLLNKVEGSQMSLAYNGTVHHGIEGICAGISSNKDFDFCSEAWSVCGTS